MDIRVSGHQIDTGEALQVHVEDRLNTSIKKHFSKAISAHVTFNKAPHDGYKCDIVAHIMHGLILKASGEAQDVHPAFDLAADRVEKQLRRYMRKLKDRHDQAAHALKEEEAAYTVFESPADDSDEEESGDAPLVIAETRVDIPSGSVSEAVMMLDLRDTNALLFKNAGTGAHNMVYRRSDGSIGWVEPQ